MVRAFCARGRSRGYLGGDVRRVQDPRPAGVCRAAGVSDVGEPGPRALDLRGMGTRRLQLCRVGRSRDPVRVRGRTRTGPLDGAAGDVRALRRMAEWLEGFS